MHGKTTIKIRIEVDMVRTVRAFACNVYVMVNIRCVFLKIRKEFENDNGSTYLFYKWQIYR
jgi:hypothetical protein